MKQIFVAEYQAPHGEFERCVHINTLEKACITNASRIMKGNGVDDNPYVIVGYANTSEECSKILDDFLEKVEG